MTEKYIRHFTLLFLISFASTARAETFTDPIMKAMGQGLYEQKGSNSCMYCHGIGGAGGSVIDAAKLNQPKTWKAWKALGGDAAYAANKEKFLEQFKEATVSVIKNGAVVHNATYKAEGFDFAKAGGLYNAQMLGLGGAPSKAWLKRYADKGVTKDIAAEALYKHLQSLDSQGAF